jgi:hypothetical protein
VFLEAVSKDRPQPYPKFQTSVLIDMEKVNNTLKEIKPILEINYFEKDNDFSSIFVRSDEKNGIEIEKSRAFTSQGEYSLKINWKTNKWGELVFIRFPENWNGYKTLDFDAYNPGNRETKMEIKVADYFDDKSFYYYAIKYTRVINIKPGNNNIKLSIDEMSKTINIKSPRKALHVRFYESASICYLDNMRLEQ